MKRWRLMVFLAAGLLASCAPFSRELMRQVDESLAFREVQKDPQRYTDKTVLWGGVIVEITNRPEETLMKVRETDLDIERRPNKLDRSAGRFLVRYAGFLDPAIYQAGREITVVGEIVGQETLPLGEFQYAYPLVSAKEIHLWPKREYLYPPHPWYWDRYPYGWYRHPYGWYHPHW